MLNLVLPPVKKTKAPVKQIKIVLPGIGKRENARIGKLISNKYKFTK